MPFACCLGGQAKADKERESKEKEQAAGGEGADSARKKDTRKESKKEQSSKAAAGATGASEQGSKAASNGPGFDARKAGGKEEDGKACCKQQQQEVDSPGSSSKEAAGVQGKQAVQEKEHDGPQPLSEWKAKGQMGSGNVRDARNLAPPSQPYDSERNTELDDARSEADSELSAPDEDQRYYPSNSEEDQSVVDEEGRKRLPKGMDLSGVETGRFKDHDNWEFDPDAPVDDNGKPILDKAKRSSEGFAKPKDIPSVTTSPRAVEQERDSAPEPKPAGLPQEEKAGPKQKRRDISVTPPSHSNSFDSRGMSPDGPHSDQQMRAPKSPGSKASTPTTSVTPSAPSGGPRYKGLVPPKKKDATPTASGTPSVAGDSGPLASTGAAGTGPESIADNVSETSVRTSTTTKSRSVAGGEDASGASPGGRKYASLVPPKKTDGQSKDKPGGRLAKLVPPKQSPKSPPSSSSLVADDKEQQQQQQAKEQQSEQAARDQKEQKEKEAQRQEAEERREIEEAQEMREIQEQEQEKQRKQQEQQQQQLEEEERREIEEQQQQRQQQQQQEKGEEEQRQQQQHEDKEKERQTEDEERREIEVQQQAHEDKQQRRLEDEERAEIKQQQEQRQQQQEAESHHKASMSAHELKKPSSSEGDDHMGEREGRASPFDPDAALAKQADKEGAQTPSASSSNAGDEPHTAESEQKVGASSEAHAGGAGSTAGSAAGSVSGSATAAATAAAGAAAGGAAGAGAAAADANGGEAGANPGLTRRSRASSSQSLDQQGRLAARKAEREAASRGEAVDAKPKPRPTGLPKPGLPRFMQPTVAYEHMVGHHEEDQEHASPSKGGRPTSARTSSPDPHGTPPPRPTTIAGVPRFMQPTAAAASLFGQTEEAKARIEAERQRHHSHERSPSVEAAHLRSVEKQRASRTSLNSSIVSGDHEHGSKIAALASKPKPDTSNLPRFMQPTAAAQGHTIYGNSDGKPTHTRFDASSAASTDEPDTSAHPEASGRGAQTARTRLPNGPTSATSSPRASQQHSHAAPLQNGEVARPATTPGRGSKLPTPQGAPRPASARPRAPASPAPATGNVPRYMQPTTAAAKPASRAQPNGSATPEEAFKSARAPARPTPPAKSPITAATPPTRRAAPGASQESMRTPPSGNGAGQPPAATPPQRKQLPFGEWFVVRLTRPMACDACKGTKEQPTVDGQKEVFKCDQTLQPKQLAVAVAHELVRSEQEGGGTAPKTWVFCPDPLCMESAPEGSKLPPWPAKLRLHDSCKISRQEYFNLKELGLEIAASSPATPPPAAAPAPAAEAAS